MEKMARRPGIIGRLTIADVGIHVALSGRDIRENNQAIVDEVDSVAYIHTDVLGDVRDIISDHVCTEKYNHGQNVLTDLLADNGASVLYQCCPGLILYTCNADGIVTITCWTPI